MSTQLRNLKYCLVHGGEYIIVQRVIEFFKDCKFKRDYEMGDVCPEGLIRLYCGYFKGKYVIIEIELARLYPKELEEIERHLLPKIHKAAIELPKVQNKMPFTYDIIGTIVVLRFYVPCEDSDNTQVISKIQEYLSPALRIVAKFLKRLVEVYD